MASYSVATTKDNLSRLIDKALAGEEVIVTRHGKPTVTLQVVRIDQADTRHERTDWNNRIGQLRRSLPAIGMSGPDLVRQLRDESAH